MLLKLAVHGGYHRRPQLVDVVNWSVLLSLIVLVYNLRVLVLGSLLVSPPAAPRPVLSENTSLPLYHLRKSTSASSSIPRPVPTWQTKPWQRALTDVGAPVRLAALTIQTLNLSSHVLLSLVSKPSAAVARLSRGNCRPQRGSLRSGTCWQSLVAVMGPRTGEDDILKLMILSTRCPSFRPSLFKVTTGV